MAKETKVIYTEKERAIVSALKANGPMTLAELNEATGLDLKPGSATSACGKGLIEKVGEKEILRDGKRKVYAYFLITAEATNKADGKPNVYSETEKNILSAVSDTPMTLADISAAINCDLSSGNINGLVRKGNVGKSAEKIEVPTKVPATVAIYGFVKDIPTDAE